MTCELCREQLKADDLFVPCDDGGLPACRFWDSHGVSPGEKEDFADAFAIVFYMETRKMGLANVLALRHLEFSEAEADEFMMRLNWLQDNFDEYEAAYMKVQG